MWWLPLTAGKETGALYLWWPRWLQGQADKDAVVAHCLAQFAGKFEFFTKNIQVGKDAVELQHCMCDTV